jgi:serine/threonine-protein kinase
VHEPGNRIVSTDLQQRLQAALVDRYRLERELGRGGMATVFLAHDLRHKRSVALKVLHPELAQTLGPERFHREIETVARLQHPHILTVHDSGEAEGLLWFTMPYVEGESLRDRLNRERQLPVEDAVRIATDAARALQYAHEHGVIHRDIKPENLLLTTDGSTLVADFGIARALAGEDQLTHTGMSVGTPAYMSPEQAAGDRAVDARTDVYSLGTVLYEMLAGEPPFTGPTAQAITAKRLTSEAPRLHLVRASVPESVEDAVARALASLPADRFGSAAEFARALALPISTAIAQTQIPGPAGTVSTIAPTSTDRAPRARPGRVAAPAFALGLLVMASMAMFLWQRSRHATLDTGVGPKRLAVIPFENLGRPEDEYFADGITDEVRGKLAALQGLKVIARSSSSQYKKTTMPPEQIGQQLGVQYLLTATVRWEKAAGGVGRVRVSPELIQVSDGTTKWQQPFESPLTDVFQVQTEIAGRVAQALDVALGAGERRTITERPTQNLAAYDAFLKGEQISQNLGASDATALRRAVAQYEQAVALDPTFVQAWVQLSRALSLVYVNGTPNPSDAARSLAAAQRAIALAPSEAGAHLALGDYLANVRVDNPGALRAYEAGLRFSPANAELLSADALTELGTGRWEPALAHLGQAQALDPRSVGTARRLAYSLLWLRRYPEALAACDRALALDPANLDVLQTKAMVFVAQGDLSGAREVVRAAPKEVEPTALVAFFGNYWDLYWVLEPEQQELLLRLPPSAFDDRAVWAHVLAQTHALRRDQARTRVYADSARIAFLERLKKAPDDPQSHVALGLAFAYLGRKAEAVRRGERGLALVPITKDAYMGAYLQHQLARIYLLVGDPEKALDLLDPLLKIPYYVSPGWLKIDPTFAPLRGNPRFERLVNGS